MVAIEPDSVIPPIVKELFSLTKNVGVPLTKSTPNVTDKVTGWTLAEIDPASPPETPESK